MGGGEFSLGGEDVEKVERIKKADTINLAALAMLGHIALSMREHGNITKDTLQSVADDPDFKRAFPDCKRVYYKER